jgi:hypothetical protein
MRIAPGHTHELYAVFRDPADHLFGALKLTVGPKAMVLDKAGTAEHEEPLSAWAEFILFRIIAIIVY